MAWQNMYSDESGICGANKYDKSVVLMVGNRDSFF